MIILMSTNIIYDYIREYCCNVWSVSLFKKIETSVKFTYTESHANA